MKKEKLELILVTFTFHPFIPRMRHVICIFTLCCRYYWNRVKEQRTLQAGDYKLGSVTVRAQLLKDHLRVEILNARHLKPPEVHRGSLAEKYARVGKLKSKSNLNMSRSQRNLDWVKSKFASLKANLNEAQVGFLKYQTG